MTDDVDPTPVELCEQLLEAADPAWLFVVAEVLQQSGQHYLESHVRALCRQSLEVRHELTRLELNA